MSQKALQQELQRLRKRISELEASEARNRETILQLQAQRSSCGTAEGADSACIYLNSLCIQPDLLLNALPEAVVLTNSNREIIYCNDPFSKTFGYPREDIRGEKIRILYAHPGDEAEQGAAIFPLPGQAPFSERLVNYRRKDGSVFPGRTFGSPIQDVHHKTVGYIDIIQDISRQCTLEKELHVKKAFFEKLVTLSPDFVYVYQPAQQEITYSNWRICQQLGYSVKEVREMGASLWANLAHPDDLPVISRNYAHLPKSNSRRIVETEYRLRHKNGEWRWFKGREIVFQRAENGDALAIMGVAADITEKRKMTGTLANRERLLHTVVESSPYGMAMINKSGEIRLVNLQLEKDFGYARDEILGQSIETLISPQARERYIDLRNQYLQCPYFPALGVDMNILGMRKNGSTFPIEVILNPITLEDETVILCTILDVTEQKRIEKALREREVFLESIFKGTEVATFVIDVTPERDFQFVELNPAHERLTGLTTAFIRGKKPEDLVPVIPVEVVAQIRANYQRCLDAGKSIQYEEMIPFDGRETWWLTRLTPIKDEAGQVYRIVGSAISITELKQIQVALKESEQRLEMALAGAELGTWDWNVQTGYVIFNQRWAEMLGYSVEEVDPHVSAWEKMLHPEDVPHTMAALNAHFNGETPVYESEQRLKTKSGEWKWILDRGKVFEWDQTGKPLRMCGTHLDITERKIAEEQIRQYAAKLEAINQELEEFSYVASHDLREPLRTINSYCELLQEDLGDNISADAREDLAFITDAARRMDFLIKDLLELSRAGRTEARMEMVDLNKCLEQVTSDLKTVIEETNGIIKWEPLPVVCADAGQISRVFLNLLNNGLKFRGEKTPEIKIKAQKNGPRWEISVTDNGIGIEKAYWEQIFQPFKRLHSKADYEGNGIGLAICRKIVERHGGKMTVKSEPGKGSTFTIIL